MKTTTYKFRKICALALALVLTLALFPSMTTAARAADAATQEDVETLIAQLQARFGLQPDGTFVYYQDVADGPMPDFYAALDAYKANPSDLETHLAAFQNVKLLFDARDTGNDPVVLSSAQQKQFALGESKFDGLRYIYANLLTTQVKDGATLDVAGLQSLFAEQEDSLIYGTDAYISQYRIAKELLPQPNGTETNLYDAPNAALQTALSDNLTTEAYTAVLAYQTALATYQSYTAPCLDNYALGKRVDAAFAAYKNSESTRYTENEWIAFVLHAMANTESTPPVTTAELTIWNTFYADAATDLNLTAYVTLDTDFAAKMVEIDDKMEGKDWRYPVTEAQNRLSEVLATDYSYAEGSAALTEAEQLLADLTTGTGVYAPYVQPTAAGGTVEGNVTIVDPRDYLTADVAGEGGDAVVATFTGNVTVQLDDPDAVWFLGTDAEFEGDLTILRGTVSASREQTVLNNVTLDLPESVNYSDAVPLPKFVWGSKSISGTITLTHGIIDWSSGTAAHFVYNVPPEDTRSIGAWSSYIDYTFNYVPWPKTIYGTATYGEPLGQQSGLLNSMSNNGDRSFLPLNDRFSTVGTYEWVTMPGKGVYDGGTRAQIRFVPGTNAGSLAALTEDQRVHEVPLGTEEKPLTINGRAFVKDKIELLGVQTDIAFTANPDVLTDIALVDTDTNRLLEMGKDFTVTSFDYSQGESDTIKFTLEGAGNYSGTLTNADFFGYDGNGASVIEGYVPLEVAKPTASLNTGDKTVTLSFPEIGASYLQQIADVFMASNYAYYDNDANGSNDGPGAYRNPYIVYQYRLMNADTNLTTQASFQEYTPGVTTISVPNPYATYYIDYRVAIYAEHWMTANNPGIMQDICFGSVYGDRLTVAPTLFGDPPEVIDDGDNGNGTGGGIPTPPENPTIPGDEGKVEIGYTEKDGEVALQLPSVKVDELIDSASDDTVELDLSGLEGVEKANIPTDALEKIADAGLGVDVKLPEGEISLDSEALQSILEQTGGTDLTMSMTQIRPNEMNEAQGAVLKSGDTVYDITVTSGGQNISQFDGGFKVTVPYDGSLPAAAWHLDGDGKKIKIEGVYDPLTGTFTFTLPHLSLYVVGYDDSPWLNPFSDVSSTDWFYGDVQFVATHTPMLFEGTSATTFSPHSPMTRAMLWTVLARLSGETITGETWAQDARAWALAEGVSDGTNPDNAVTRNQIVTMLYRYAEIGSDGYDGEALAWAQELKIMNDGRPDDAATRAEVAAMLHRFVDNIA
jgi:hypothetical protein